MIPERVAGSLHQSETTALGGRVVGVELSGPTRLLVQPPAGDEARLWISDTGNRRIIEADLPTAEGVIVIRRTHALDARARTPRGLASNADGTALYIADTESNTVWMLDPGAAACRCACHDVPAPTDLVMTRDGRRLLVTSASTHQVWQFDVRSGAAKPLVGSGERGLADGTASAAAFANPAAVCSSSDGRRLYIADADSSAIREVDHGTHYTATVAGRAVGEHGYCDGDFASARLNLPGAVAAVPGPEGDRIVVADTGNNVVRMIDPRSRSVETWLNGQLGLREPQGLACAQIPGFGPAVLISDTGGNRLIMSHAETRECRLLVCVYERPEISVVNRERQGSDQDPAAARAMRS